MAHSAKYAKSAIGHLCAHYMRLKIYNKETGQHEYVKFNNQDIDPTRTHLNYNLAPERKASQVQFIKQRVAEVPHSNRKDLNVMCDWVVTMPRAVKRFDGAVGIHTQEEIEKLFFERVYDFLTARYGEDNVVSAFVHMDEISPHMHYAFVPVVYNPETGEPKTVSAKTLISRGELKCFHTDLERYLDSFEDYHFEVINEATKEGNRTVAELKQQSNIEKTKQTEKELEAVKEKLEAYKAAEVSAEQIAEAGITLPFGFTLQKKAESDAIKATAQKYVASLEREKELARRESAVAVREIHADNYMREIDEKCAKFADEQRQYKVAKQDFDRRVKSLDEGLKAVKYLEGLPAEHKKLQDNYKAVCNENTTLRGRVETLERTFEQRVSEATQKLEKTVDDLKKKLEEAYGVLTCAIKAVGMLKYDKTEGFKVEGLSKKQSKLIDVLAQYGAGWARDRGFPDKAEDMEKHIGLSKGIKKLLNPDSRQVTKGFHDEGPSLD